MGLLSLSDAGKSYWRGAHEIVALRDATFSLEAGDFAAVNGDRAAGKTTLLRIAAGIERPDTGMVSFEGRDIATMSDREQAELRSRSLGCVWAGAPWAARRALDAVCVPLLVGRGMSRRAARRRATDELRRWDVEDAANAAIHELSAAERQRVAFAAALVREPRVLLADDPTETLNFAEQKYVLANLQRIVREERIAVLMTTTDATGAGGINRLFVLVGNGEVREAQSLQPAPVVPFPTRSQSSGGDA